jgi:hypothetical protein
MASNSNFLFNSISLKSFGSGYKGDGAHRSRH